MKSSSITSLLIAIALLILAGVGYFFWYGQVEALSARAATLTAEVAAKKDDATRLAAAKASLATVAGDAENIDEYFVASDSVVPFLEELQATGKSFGAVVDIASVAADMKSAQPHLTLSLKIEGSFDAVLRTLGTFEYAPRDMIANDLSLSMVGGDRWAATGTFTVGGKETKKQAASQPAATSTTP